MTIADAFDGVFPETQPVTAAATATAATATAERPARPKVVPIDRARPHAAARRRTPAVTRLARVVYLDAADSWIAEERSPSAKTVWATNYTADMDTVWAPYRMWTHVYRPPAVLFALLCDAIKFLLIHPFRGPLTLGAAAAIYLLATH